MRRGAIAAALFLLLGGASAGAAVRIDGDPGGRIDQYLSRFEQLRASGERVIVDGPCNSACTLLLGKLPVAEPVVALTKASLADIKQGSFVGVTGLPQPDGSQKALEVHIFPDAMRGTGEGHRGWDLQPSSTMTNGAVEQTSASADGQVLTLKYKDGEKKIVVSAETPIVIYVPGEKSELKPGTPIFISAATRQPDGTLQTPRVNVGRGVAPPM